MNCCNQFATNSTNLRLGLVTIVLLRLVTVGDDLPLLIYHQPMIIILINMCCSKKKNVFYKCVHSQ